MGLFVGAHTATFDLHIQHGYALLTELFAQDGPVAVVCCALGAAYGFYARSTTVMWSFDSHGENGSGARACRWDSAPDMIANVMRSALAERAVSQFSIFSPGSDDALLL